MYGRSPQRIARNDDARLLERLKSLEQRLSGIERRGASATYQGVDVPLHAGSHAQAGSDPITPGSINAASVTQLNLLQSDVNALPVSYAETITGDGSDTTFEITHNKATRDLIVAIRENASPWALLDPTSYSAEYTTTNKIDLTFTTAPGVGQELRVLIVAF